MILIYQALADTMQQVAAQTTATAKSINLWELIAQGGVLMIPLALLLVAAVYFFVERNIAISKASRIDPNFMNIVRDHIMNGNITAARSLTKNTDHPVARIIDKGLQRLGKPIDAIEKSMENVGRIEMYNMERNINVLSMIAGMAPMFGFLGTIIGMIQMFYEINSTGRFELNSIAGGIYVKMITSATGLIIGLMAYLFYNYLNTQVDKTANKMEVASAEFLDTLQEPHK
ncbi:MAG: MotA/TolQ/ExbB proton channel family protein [Bacteroidetes bacterium]|jgi:biopolymer transport protein ExbB|uniref:MotA/TolQ/ExbB proton channel family protein n=1 Tax=unclassified Phnomibacter TaxID=2836226 RepID=UPI002FDCDE30|nr:MotA/TolQ/ExbB proton channel family protein [Bacteroidota bacterium]MCC6761785.1 MotA/TolQ/ExbB proton channel family protein [Chitinophagaceae bacterium]